jgi:hypothetical protein
VCFNRVLSLASNVNGGSLLAQFLSLRWLALVIVVNKNKVLVFGLVRGGWREGFSFTCMLWLW